MKKLDYGIELENGALNGMASGAKMDKFASIFELTDNVIDARGTEMRINVRNGVLSIIAKEELDYTLETANVFFKLGRNQMARTNKNGVGKYSQGFKYACANLVGNNRGDVILEMRNRYNQHFGIKWILDYSNPQHYSDKELYEIPVNELTLPKNYQFMVRIPNVYFKDIYEETMLRIKLGIRYREIIEDDKCAIYLNGIKIKPIDRLYSNQNKQFLKDILYKRAEFNINDSIVIVETCDLRNKVFEDYEYNLYDNSGIKGRNKGVNVENRRGIEISINGITISECGNISSILGVSPQPSSNGFRARISAEGCFFDKYINGANKSDCNVIKGFYYCEEMAELLEFLNKEYNDAVQRNKESDRKNYKSSFILNELMKECNINRTFGIVANKCEVSFKEENPNSPIIINCKSEFFEKCKITTKESAEMFVYSILYGMEITDEREIINILNDFEIETNYKLKQCKNK